MADKKISALTAATTPLAGTEVLPIVQSGTTKQVSIANVTAGRAVAASSLTTTAGTSVLGTAASTLLATFGDNLTVNTTILQIKRNAGVTDKPILQGIIAGVGASNIILQKDGGDVEIGAGNIIIGTAGKGIDFSAATHAAGMTSELLNDYEEGTWTPAVASSLGSITTVTATGKYTKIGRQVTIEISATVTDNGTGAGSVRIGGLPYTAESTGYTGAGFNTSSGEALAVGFAATNTLVVYKYNVLYPVTTGQGFAIVVTYFV
jgi:hypothetical protein